MGENVVINTSGLHGQPGVPGINGSSGSYSGSDGQAGGNAGFSFSGQDAGLIDLVLHSADDNNVMLNGESSCTVNDEVQLIACGGNGGNGGNGGCGGNGAKGSRGRNATRYSSGGNGGDGGNAGSGSDGAPGGAGGGIHVHVSFQETHLLMLLSNINFSGGSGGIKGQNGIPGSGGRGGSGGSSYTWTESRTERGRDGKSVTRTSFHSNPGGFSGSSGRSGIISNYVPQNGRPGCPGNLNINVQLENSNEIAVYHSIYQLMLVGFEFESNNGDGINEPGESVHVSKFRVQNIGGMPTPAYQKVFLNIDSSTYFTSNNIALEFDREILPGEIADIEGNVTLILKDCHVLPAIEGPLCIPDLILPHSTIGNIARRFPGFSTGQEMIISYPIVITKLMCPVTISTGQTTRVIWQIQNVSTCDYGESSASGRVIKVFLSLSSHELSYEDVTFIDNMDVEHFALRDQFEINIPLLRAGETFVYEGYIQVRSAAPAYTSCRIQVDLGFGELLQANEIRKVQYRSTSFRLSETYTSNPSSKCLLVVNTDTTHNEVLAWRDVLENKFCLGHVCIWDVTVNGHLDLKQPVGVAQSRLIDDYRGKLIVILDYPFGWVTTKSDEASRICQSSKLLDHSQYFEARTNYVCDDDIAVVEKISRKNLLHRNHFRIYVHRKILSSAHRDRIIRKVKEMKERVAKLFPNERFMFVYRVKEEEDLKTIGYIDVMKTFDFVNSKSCFNISFSEQIQSIEYITGPTLQDELMYSIPMDQQLQLLEVSCLRLSAKKVVLFELMQSVTMLCTAYQNHGLESEDMDSNCSRLMHLLEYCVPPTIYEVEFFKQDFVDILISFSLFMECSYTFKYKCMFNTRMSKVYSHIMKVLDRIAFKWLSHQMDTEKQWSKSKAGKEFKKKIKSELKTQAKAFHVFQKSDANDDDLANQIYQYMFNCTRSASIWTSWSSELSNLNFCSSDFNSAQNRLSKFQQQQRTRLEYWTLHNESQEVFFPEQNTTVEIVLNESEILASAPEMAKVL